LSEAIGAERRFGTDGYVHHRNTVKVKGASFSEGEVTVVSRTNRLSGKFLFEIVAHLLILFDGLIEA
jgi:hypothetical protein